MLNNFQKHPEFFGKVSSLLYINYEEAFNGADLLLLCNAQYIYDL